jgi:hypothetical protein
MSLRSVPGRLLLHDHNLLHSAPPLAAGRKYVLRTDVLFERAAGGAMMEAARGRADEK